MQANRPALGRQAAPRNSSQKSLSCRLHTVRMMGAKPPVLAEERPPPVDTTQSVCVWMQANRPTHGRQAALRFYPPGTTTRSINSVRIDPPLFGAPNAVMSLYTHGKGSVGSPHANDEPYG